MINTALLLILIVLVIYYGERIMAAIDDLRAQVAQITTDLAEVSSDVDSLIAGLPGEGGLNAEQVAELKNSLANVSSGLRTVADKYTPPA